MMNIELEGKENGEGKGKVSEGTQIVLSSWEGDQPGGNSQNENKRDLHPGKQDMT